MSCERHHRQALSPGYSMAGMSRNTLANANQRRDWRIYAEFAQRHDFASLVPMVSATRGPGAGRSTTLSTRWTRPPSKLVPVGLSVGVVPLPTTIRSCTAAHVIGDAAGQAFRRSFGESPTGRCTMFNVLDMLGSRARRVLHHETEGTWTSSGEFLLRQRRGVLHHPRQVQRRATSGRYSRPVDKTSGVRCDQTVVVRPAR